MKFGMIYLVIQEIYLKKSHTFFLKSQMKMGKFLFAQNVIFYSAFQKMTKNILKNKIKRRLKFYSVSFKIKNRNIPKEFSIFHLGAMDWKPKPRGRRMVFKQRLD